MASIRRLARVTMPTTPYLAEPTDDDGVPTGAECLFVVVEDADGNVIADRPATAAEQTAVLARVAAGEDVI